MIDVAMLDSQVAILENAIARYFATGEVPRPIGARHPSISPFDAFRTADGDVVICAGNDVIFTALCTAIGRDDLAAQEQFRTNEGRTENEVLLKLEVERTLSSATSSHWLRLLEAAGIPAGPLNDVEHVLRDPQVSARNMIVTAEDPTVGQLHMAGNPIKMSAFDDPSTRRTAPDLDGDRERILADFP